MTVPLAILYIHQAMLIVPLVILALLALLLFNGLIQRRSQEDVDSGIRAEESSNHGKQLDIAAADDVARGGNACNLDFLFCGGFGLLTYV